MRAGEADDNMGFGIPPGEEYMEGPFSGDMEYGTMNSGMDEEQGMTPNASGEGAINLSEKMCIRDRPESAPALYI